MTDEPRDRSPLLDPTRPPFSEEVSNGAMTAAIAIVVVAVGIVASAIMHKGEMRQATKGPVLATTATAPWR